jgi:hypothetical protein
MLTGTQNIYASTFTFLSEGLIVAIYNLENVKFGLGDHDFICGQHIYMFRRNPKKFGGF